MSKKTEKSLLQIESCANIVERQKLEGNLNISWLFEDKLAAELIVSDLWCFYSATISFSTFQAL